MKNCFKCGSSETVVEVTESESDGISEFSVFCKQCGTLLGMGGSGGGVTLADVPLLFDLLPGDTENTEERKPRRKRRHSRRGA